MRQVHTPAHFELSCQLVTSAIDALKRTRFSQGSFGNDSIKDIVEKKYLQSLQSTDAVANQSNDNQVVVEEPNFHQRFSM